MPVQTKNVINITNSCAYLYFNFMSPNQKAYLLFHHLAFVVPL